MTIARTMTQKAFLIFLTTLPIAACTDGERSSTKEPTGSNVTVRTDGERSICEEHMGSNVTVYANGFQTISGEMFYCYGDGGFMVSRDDETMVSFPYHSVTAVVVSTEDFLIPIPD